jgi:hypothetical protein
MAFAKPFRREHRASRWPGGLRRSARSEHFVSRSLSAVTERLRAAPRAIAYGSAVNEECGGIHLAERREPPGSDAKACRPEANHDGVYKTVSP